MSDYKIETIAEHSFIPSLLRYMSPVLDLGCRGWEFSEPMRKKYYVFAVDIDYLEPLPNGETPPYFQCAITDFDGSCGLIESEDKQAVRMDKKGTGIRCDTLKSFSEKANIYFWDLIKMDIEGSEYEVIMSLDKAPAKQLSIEFHLHTGIYGQAEMTMMEDKLKALGYETVQHVYEPRHGCSANYWDSLFVLK